MNLYVLLLEEEKYYVGMAEDIGLRLWTHFKMSKKTGSAWTKIYKPVSVVHCSQHIGTMNDFKIIEQQATLRLAKLKGFSNVRGGGFSLTAIDYPESWDKKLTTVPPADMNKMTPLNAKELKNLMIGKYDLWREKRLEGIKRLRTKLSDEA